MTTIHELFHTPQLTREQLAKCDGVVVVAVVATGELVTVRETEGTGHSSLFYPHAQRPTRRTPLRVTASQLLRSLGLTHSSLHLVDVAPPPTGATSRRPTAVYAACVELAAQPHPSVCTLGVTRTEVASMDLRPHRVTELFIRAGATPVAVVAELAECRRRDPSFTEIDRADRGLAPGG